MRSRAQSSHSQSGICRLLGVHILWGQGHFQNNTKTLFAIFTLLTFFTICYDKSSGGYNHWHFIRIKAGTSTIWVTRLFALMCLTVKNKEKASSLKNTLEKEHAFLIFCGTQQKARIKLFPCVPKYDGWEKALCDYLRFALNYIFIQRYFYLEKNSY